MGADALAHYWGGPRLTENPLLQLQIVRQAAIDHDGSAVKALREVLADAIERHRPMETAVDSSRVAVVHILEMKFLRGEKVRQVAMRLAVSESDLYRKQRIAIENLAAFLLILEREAQDPSATV